MRSLWAIIGSILRFYGLQNIILIEAEHAKRENSEAVLQELLRRGWNRRYKIVLYSNAPEAIVQYRQNNVSIIKRATYGDSRFVFLRFRWLRLRSRLIIDENMQTNKYDPKTIHVFLSHGSCLKSVRDFYNCKPDTDYMLSQSEFWNPINENQLRIPQSKLVTLGFPRNDVLFKRKLDPFALFGKSYNKIVVWYPTYRQYNGYRESEAFQDSFSIPIVHDTDIARMINNSAAKYNILLVLKPHPAQDVSYIQDLNLDHLITVNDSFFLERHTTDYAFLGNTDALITDYSSVVFDYLLTGKPIALAQEDYEEYEKKVGFAVDMDLLRGCSTMLNCAEDFDAFFRDLVSGNDPLREKRDALMHLTNRYTDGNSTQRVVDWLETLL